ncbi:S8 family serine peptidase [Sandaracinus amylolyticus]|nr:S8 family serine peptidase [Sandaracinus amylolyticus]
MVVRIAVVALLVLLSGTARAQMPPRLARALASPRYPRQPLLSPAGAVGAPLVWARHGLGEGATICVIDTGVDPRHRDLRDADGHTRIEWLVDLERATPTGDHLELEARYGVAIHARATIDAALAAGTPLPGDRHGHGTAIASIAAGDDSGGDTPGPLAGVAPRASLIVVRTLRADAAGFEDDDVVRATELCFALTDDPARTVALLALGGHDGAHDASEPLSRALGAMAREGRALVVAAGNDGDRAIHATGRALPGAPARVTLHVPTPRTTDAHWVAMVVRGARDVSWVAPNGTSLRAREGEIAMTGHESGYLLLDARDAGAMRAVVGGGGADAMLHAGDYELVIEGRDVPFDAWIVEARLGATLGTATLDGVHVVPGESVTIPATTPEVIAVGASISHAEHGALALQARDDGSATFSARGPSSAGRPRPDVIAPGGFFAAALSSDLEPDDPWNLIGGSRPVLDRRRVDETHLVLEGSSAAAAVVAGAYALALATSPADLERDRALLATTTDATDATDAWTDTRGAGVLRVDRWLDARLAPDVARAIDPERSALSLTRTLALPRATDVHAIARVIDVDGAPVHGGELVLRTNGRVLARAAIAHGRAEAPITIDAPAGERVVIEGEASGIAIGASAIDVRVDESARGIAVPRGGAHCAIGARREGSLVWIVIALALLARRR